LLFHLWGVVVGSSHCFNSPFYLCSFFPSSIILLCIVKDTSNALTCNHRFDESFQQEHTSNAQAYIAAPLSSVDQNWYPDSVASHHITSDQIHVGNGTGLSIKHIGTAQISTPSFKFKLNNILHVPQIRKNLLSVHQFTKATNTYFEFHPYKFFVKEQVTGNTLLQGQSNHELYLIPSFSNVNKSRDPTALVGEHASVSS
jgi:hypothetical protein